MKNQDTKKVVYYQVFDQDTKRNIRTYYDKQDAIDYCKKLNRSSKASGGSSTQYGVDETVREV